MGEQGRLSPVHRGRSRLRQVSTLPRFPGYHDQGCFF